MTFKQLILVAMTLGISTASAVTASLQGGDAPPVRKRTHLRHLSSNAHAHAHAEEHDESYDPFIGIPPELQAEKSMSLSMSMRRKLRADRVMSMPSSMSMEQAALTFTSCNLDCGKGQICAFSSPGSEPLCYPKCLPSFPVFSAGDGKCRSGDVCIHR